MTTRRNFIELLGASAALPALAPAFPTNASLPPVASAFDMSWIDQVTKPHKFVIDSPSIHEGSGLWRAVALMQQYQDNFGVFPNEISAVLVLRHEAIVLTMDNSYWQEFGIGEMAEQKDKEGKWKNENPIGPANDEKNPRMAKYTLPGFIANGGIVLACDMAFRGFVVTKYQDKGKSTEDAHAEGLSHLLPGVILQPSGFFATVRAQQAGCAAFFNG